MNRGPELLIVDDDEGMRFFLGEAMGKAGYAYTLTASGEEAIINFKKSPYPIVILDIKMPGIDGIETARRLKRLDPEVIVIFITAHGLEDIPEGMVDEVYDYFTKPFDLNDMRVVIKRAHERCLLKRELKALRSAVDRSDDVIIVGVSRKMEELSRMIRRVAAIDVNILITGESGTGKELVAKALHQKSNRRSGPFVEVGCVSIPETLLEAELFGYEKGGFTGAHRQKKGRVECAEGGTLFLDEVGELPLSTQVKLLRLIQERTVTRIGGTRPIEVDFRLIAATNRDIQKEVTEGRFRDDLFYRLNVVSIPVPPLRERPDDIPLLAEHFLNRYRREFKREGASISREALGLFTHYQWPGNVRELENLIQRGIVLAEEGGIDREVAEILLNQRGAPADGSLKERVEMAMEVTEIENIRGALASAGGRREKAARILQISRKSLYNKMRRYRLL
ncbi:MAG: response regulator [Deltaproteobacteria bacterium]|nr:response regulator [Deltaproteobacteria bacterium]